MIPSLPNDIRFLILDDVAVIRKTLLSQLQKMGQTYPPCEAQDVKEALDILENTRKKANGVNSIQFILSDWNLPDDSGLSLLKIVRADTFYDQVPFLMITSEDSISNMIEAVNSGATNYMVKPWEYEDLISKIEGCWALMHKDNTVEKTTTKIIKKPSSVESTKNIRPIDVNKKSPPTQAKNTDKQPEQEGFFSKLFRKK